MTFNEIHARLGNTALLYMLIVSLWGFYRFFRKQGVDSSYWGVLAIAEVLLILQVAFGIYLWVEGFRPPRSIHVLYGLLIPALIPGAYFYTRGRNGRPEILVYGTATIITVGLIIRAIYTGQVTL
ncbi:MAG: hypothetical protein O3B43_00330 [Chloroflexi bacterium]|nr:hypothetical protein [Chloroflexota bacterium]